MPNTFKITEQKFSNFFFFNFPILRLAFNMCHSFEAIPPNKKAFPKTLQIHRKQIPLSFALRVKANPKTRCSYTVYWHLKNVTSKVKRMTG